MSNNKHTHDKCEVNKLSLKIILVIKFLSVIDEPFAVSTRL